MKRTFCYLAAAVALLTSGACTDFRKPAPASTPNKETDKVYTGVLPGADVDGIRYTILLDFDDKGTGGDYDMVQTYFMAGPNGVRDVASFACDGGFTIANNNGRKYIRLDDNGAGEMYFIADTDSTITMVDATLKPAATPGMNYTLKAAR